MAKKKRSTAKKKEIGKPAILIACEGISKGVDGKMTLYGIFDRFILDDLKQQTSFYVYVKLKGSGVHSFLLDIIDPSGKSIYVESKEKPRFEADLKDRGLQANMQIVVAFKKVGTYHLMFKSGRKTLATYSIEIEKKVSK